MHKEVTVSLTCEEGEVIKEQEEKEGKQEVESLKENSARS